MFYFYHSIYLKYMPRIIKCMYAYAYTILMGLLTYYTLLLLLSVILALCCVCYTISFVHACKMIYNVFFFIFLFTCIFSFYYVPTYKVHTTFWANTSNHYDDYYIYFALLIIMYACYVYNLVAWSTQYDFQSVLKHGLLLSTI